MWSSLARKVGRGAGGGRHTAGESLTCPNSLQHKEGSLPELGPAGGLPCSVLLWAEGRRSSQNSVWTGRGRPNPGWGHGIESAATSTGRKDSCPSRGTCARSASAAGAGVGLSHTGHGVLRKHWVQRALILRNTAHTSSLGGRDPGGALSG